MKFKLVYENKKNQIFSGEFNLEKVKFGLFYNEKIILFNQDNNEEFTII
jgi:hypothetical protein